MTGRKTPTANSHSLVSVLDLYFQVREGAAQFTTESHQRLQTYCSCGATCRCGVSTRTSWPGVCVMSLGTMTRLTYSPCLSVAARTIAQADLSLRYTLTIDRHCRGGLLWLRRPPRERQSRGSNLTCTEGILGRVMPVT